MPAAYSSKIYPKSLDFFPVSPASSIPALSGPDAMFLGWDPVGHVLPVCSLLSAGLYMYSRHTFVYLYVHLLSFQDSLLRLQYPRLLSFRDPLHKTKPPLLISGEVHSMLFFIVSVFVDIETLSS